MNDYTIEELRFLKKVLLYHETDHEIELPLIMRLANEIDDQIKWREQEFRGIF